MGEFLQFMLTLLGLIFGASVLMALFIKFLRGLLFTEDSRHG